MTDLRDQLSDSIRNLALEEAVSVVREAATFSREQGISGNLDPMEAVLIDGVLEEIIRAIRSLKTPSTLTKEN